MSFVRHALPQILPTIPNLILLVNLIRNTIHVTPNTRHDTGVLFFYSDPPQGGDLFDAIAADIKYSESVARDMVHDLADALQVNHVQGPGSYTETSVCL